jgi:hypothetical protein
MSNVITPWSKPREALLATALFLAAVGLYSFTWSYGVAAGVSSIGAERVLRGEIPYRDFWTMYAPGHFYLLALIFRIFGSHIFVEAVAASVVCAAASLVFYGLVFNLVGRRALAIACAGIFVAATYNTGFYRTLGTYPPAIFFVLAALNFIVLHYKAGRSGHLIAAGLATGAAVAFKHDVGGYTAIAILAGLIAHTFQFSDVSSERARSLAWKLPIYCSGIAVIVFPVATYFAVRAGWDALQDVIIFPLTDFRFSRGEHYPSIFDFNIYGTSFLNSLSKLFEYIKFALPFILFLFGFILIGLKARKRKPAYIALAVVFSAAFLLHYAAAHVQINTHIISLSIYAALLGAMLFDLLEGEFGRRRDLLIKVGTLAVGGVWFLSLVAEPADKVWTDRKKLTAELKLAKVSGQKVSPQLVSVLSDLLPLVDAHLAPDDHVFLGLNRHDIVIVGANSALYFMLDRPIATRYHEIHPAVVDTADVQREIIRDLQDKNVSLLILNRVFSDETLNRVKESHLRNLPNIGATDLDSFIRANYVQVREFGKLSVWKRKDIASAVSAGENTLYGQIA